MLITENIAVKVRKKRAVKQLGKVELSKKLGITPPTLSKIEAGNYKAPKRIYASVMEWLAEDYQKGRNKMNKQVSIFEEVNGNMRQVMQVIATTDFQGHQLDIYGDIQEPLFMARDVAEMIDYSQTTQGKWNVAKMISLVDEDEKLKGIPKGNTLINSGTKVWFLTEHGLYEVLMRSSKPKAKEFKKAVKNILKEIRLNGYYMQGELIQNSQPTPDIDDLSYVKQKLTDLQNVDSLQDLRWKMAKLYHVIETLDEY